MSQSNTRDAAYQVADKEKEFLQLKSVIAEFSEPFKHDMTVSVASIEGSDTNVEFVIKGASSNPHTWVPDIPTFISMDVDHRITVQKGGFRRKIGLKARAVAEGHLNGQQLKELFTGNHARDETTDIVVLGSSNEFPKLASLRLRFQNPVPVKQHDVVKTQLEAAGELIMNTKSFNKLDKAAKFLHALLGLKDIIGDLHPAIQVTFGVLGSLEDKLKEQIETRASISDFLDSMMSMLPFTDLMREKVSKLNVEISSQTLQKMLDVLKEASELALKYCTTPLLQLFMPGSEFGDKSKELKQTFIAFKEDYDRCIGSEIWTTVLSIDYKLTLEKLNPAEGAKYDPDNVCLTGTRVDLLERIRAWVASDQDPVLWVHGAAGMGKSSVATSVAVQMGDMVRGYFFCKRDKAGLRDPGKVLPTIALTLATSLPEFGNLVGDALEKERDLGSQAINQQFKGLFETPLRELKEKNAIMPKTLLVLDAIDELILDEDDLFNQERKRESLIKSLCRLQSFASWLKVLVTSRPLKDVIYSFQACKGCWLGINMQEAMETDLDIEKYLSKNLGEIALQQQLLDWPSSQDVTALAKKASGLFIWASTVYKYLREVSDVEQYVQDLIMDKEKGKAEEELYGLYNSIINMQKRKGNQEDSIKLLSVVSITAKHSLIPIQAYAKVLQISRKAAENVLKSFMSILYVDQKEGVVSAYHKSFLDFLEEKEYPQVLGMGLAQINSKVSLWCLELMSESLRFNICDLTSSYLSNDEVKDLQDKIIDKIPLPFKFACLHWFEFITQESMLFEPEEHRMYIRKIFMSPSLLYYLEVLSIFQCIGRVFQCTEILETVLSKQSGNDIDSLKTMLKELEHFIKRTSSCFQHSTPHLYVSALTWVPLSAEMFQKNILPHFAHKSIFNDAHSSRENTAQLSISNALSSVCAVAYSPDGRYIVSGSWDNTVRVWDAQTGAQKGEPLTGHPSTVTSVAYSPDGTIRVWDAQTGAQKGEPLTGHTARVSSAAYSPDGNYIVSGSYDNTVRVQETQESQSGIHTKVLQSLSCEEWSNIKDGNVKCKVDYDGWIRSSDGYLIFWVPHNFHHGLQDLSVMCLPKSHPDRPVSLDPTDAFFGEEWTRVKQDNS
ncbi:hypothetical protein SCHPADRAFT_852271 [Schizopora paradoxa]|uniref:Nephrocystin 3-like N-terminal domain-containing protein n=1 Tax=Schizopora paradoxa TaxID=27342 RepID=A0A0H2RVV4_9AGAM|nr:hypothetical protein SCHPADRAFT_852271 [Schizopora paradoxa]